MKKNNATRTNARVLSTIVAKPVEFDLSAYVRAMVSLEATNGKEAEARKALGASLSQRKLLCYAETVSAIVSCGVEAWNKTRAEEARTLLKQGGVSKANAKRYTETSRNLLLAKPALIDLVKGAHNSGPVKAVMGWFKDAGIKNQSHLTEMLSPKPVLSRAKKAAKELVTFNADEMAEFNAELARLQAESSKLAEKKRQAKEAAEAQRKARAAAKAGDKALKAREIEARREGAGK